METAAAADARADHDAITPALDGTDDGADDATWAGCDVRHYSYDWQRRDETPEQRADLLDGIRRTLRARAAAFLTAQRDAVLLLATPPGTGKSTAVAALGDPDGPLALNVAWVAERHDMAQQVEPLARYTHIHKCSPENCPQGYAQHQALLDRGLPTWAFHRRHQCAYARQFAAGGSAFYQLAHVHTAHPAKHPDGIVVDELNLTAWLEPYEVTRERLLEAEWYAPGGSPARDLLAATLRVLHEARLARTALHGLSLFAALDAHLDGHLADVLAALRAEPDATVLYPTPNLDLDAPDAASRLRQVPTRVLAHLWRGLTDEAPRYRHVGSGEWNSRLRVGPGRDRTGDWTLYLTAPRSFRTDEAGALPPRVVLDGTADVGLLRRLLPGAAVDSYALGVPDDLPPPPRMRHIAVRKRTSAGGVKRYSKSSLTGPDGADGLRQAIHDVACVLDRLDGDGGPRRAGRVGLITFAECEEQMREALGIPAGRTGHFWAERGSNAFAECDLLLVVGRPALNEEAIFRMGSVLYADDDAPLVPGMEQAADRTYRYRDARLEHLADTITRAEFAQCAHRNRPLIYDGRTVVTFCDEDVAFLPVTTEVRGLPDRRRAHEEGTDERLGRAGALLDERGQERTVRALQAALRELYGQGLRTELVVRWRRDHPGGAVRAA